MRSETRGDEGCDGRGLCTLRFCFWEAFSLYLVWCRVESTYIVDRMVYYYLILHERGQAHGSAAGKATRNKDGRKDN